jgi:hypothetical protein
MGKRVISVCYEQIGILYRFDTKQHRDIYHRFVYDGNRIAVQLSLITPTKQQLGLVYISIAVP